MRFPVQLFLVALLCLCASPIAQAGLLLNLTNVGGTPPTFDGGGSLVDVVTAAAEMWQSAFSSDTVNTRSVDISYGWGTLPTGVVGRASNLSSQLDEFGGTLTFDNDGSTSFFVDPTPNDNSEWSTFTESSQDLGGGLVNTGRKYSDPSAVIGNNFDLLTVALHEIGHALGWKFNNIFPPNTAHIISAPSAFVGTAIPIDRLTTHVNQGAADLPSVALPDAVMGPIIPFSNRLTLSGVDIVLVAEQLGFNSANAVAVPESSSVLLVGLVGLFVSAPSIVFGLKKRFGLGHRRRD